jgi:hypothetical protein
MSEFSWLLHKSPSSHEHENILVRDVRPMAPTTKYKGIEAIQD